MISYLKGMIEKVTDKHIEIDVNGIGYIVMMPASSLAGLPSKGGLIKIYISESTAMYGGETTLYGFLNEDERELFVIIKSVSKIGAKAALDILSKIAGAFPDFKEAIISRDMSVLTGIIGLTPKTSEKLILGLKSKIKKIEIKGAGKKMKGTPVMDAIGGLVSMGYREAEAREAVNYACDKLPDNAPVEDIIKNALHSFRRNQ